MFYYIYVCIYILYIHYCIDSLFWAFTDQKTATSVQPKCHRNFGSDDFGNVPFQRSSTAAGEGPPIRGLYQTKRGGLDLFFRGEKKVTSWVTVPKNTKTPQIDVFGLEETYLPWSFCFEGWGGWWVNMLDDLFFYLLDLCWIFAAWCEFTRVKVYALSLSKVVSSLCIDVDSSFRTYITFCL